MRMIFLVASTAWPVYIPAALLFGLLGFITLIAWATRATAVAALAIGLCIVAGGLLVLWTSYLMSVEGPFDYGDRVFLRLVAAVFVSLLIVQGLIAKRCWQADRARRDARRAAQIAGRATAEDFDQKWLLSLLQNKMVGSGEKVSSSAAALPVASDAPGESDSATS